MHGATRPAYTCTASAQRVSKSVTRTTVPRWQRRYFAEVKRCLNDEKPSEHHPPITSLAANTAPVLRPSSEKHHDLPSFLAYAAETNLPRDRTVFVGTHYEYTVASSLRRLGFSLTRTGRTSDLGVDLVGHWAVPCFPVPARVLLQCKATAEGPRPRHIRELEGAFAGAPAGWRVQGGVLGLLAATKEATKGVRDALGRSRWPLGFLMVEAEDGRVEQFLWNKEATDMGLEGMGVAVRYLPGKGGEGGVSREIALTWKGEPLSVKEADERSPA